MKTRSVIITKFVQTSHDFSSFVSNNIMPIAKSAEIIYSVPNSH